MGKAGILVVEDECLLVEDIQERLKNLSYVLAAVAHSGEEALASVAAAQPDLVLMDIRGNTDAIDTARVVRKRFNLPVVYLTGEADGATLERAKATEPLGYLLNPQATRVNIRLAASHGKLILEVQDNGKGVTARDLSGAKSLGLLGMRERAMMLDGEVTIVGRRGKGTTVGLRIPLIRSGEATST